MLWASAEWQGWLVGVALGSLHCGRVALAWQLAAAAASPSKFRSELSAIAIKVQNLAQLTAKKCEFMRRLIPHEVLPTRRDRFVLSLWIKAKPKHCEFYHSELRIVSAAAATQQSVPPIRARSIAPGSAKSRPLSPSSSSTSSVA